MASGGRNRFTQDEFIRRARKVHGDKYLYDRVKYVKMHDHIEIGCPTHGYFWQKPMSHVAGQGCGKCGTTKASSAQTNDTNYFIQKAKEIHGDRYDYSMVVYERSKHKVEIVCRKHGSFLQTPNSHLCGRGCPGCKSDSVARSILHAPDIFLGRAEDVHGEKYDYSRVNYKGVDKKVEIICADHGSFWQTPSSHIRMSAGCPLCSRRDAGWGHKGFYSTDRESNIYVINLSYGKEVFIKVGLAKELKWRHYVIQKQSGYEIETLLSLSGPANFLYNIEKTILFNCGFKKHSPTRAFCGDSECFKNEEYTDIKNKIEEMFYAGTTVD